jgi:hypothetical protein
MASSKAHRSLKVRNGHLDYSPTVNITSAKVNRLVSNPEYFGDYTIENLEQILVFHQKNKDKQSTRRGAHSPLKSRVDLRRATDFTRRTVGTVDAVASAASNSDTDDDLSDAELCFHLVDAPLLTSCQRCDDWMSSPIILDATNPESDFLSQEITRFFLSVSEVKLFSPLCLAFSHLI